MPPTYSPEHQRLLEAIYPIIVEKGLKSTTMDLVAQRLGMSKRTLYEIFENKNEMIKATMQVHTDRHHERIAEIIAKSPDTMRAFIDIIELHRKDLHSMNVSFFRDMDRLYPDLRDSYEDRRKSHRNGLQSLYDKGVGEGVFRSDVNFGVLSAMMEIQGESLKRMEELFPPGITLLDIYDTMASGFLRSLASRKGHDILDEYQASRNQNQTSQ